MTSVRANFTWPEIVEKILEKTNEANNKEFREWLLTKEFIGYHADYFLWRHAFGIYKKITKQDNDHFTIIAGSTGSGKSVLGLIYCAMISPSFSMQHICFSIEDFFKIIKVAERGDSILLDEGAMFLFSREAMNKTNKGIIKLFDLVRQKGFHFVACIPNYYHIDSDIKNARSDTLLHIRKDKDTYRGITKPGIDIINDVPSVKSIMSVKMPYTHFWNGYWTKCYPVINDITEEAYRKKKKDHLNKFIEDISKELITEEQPVASMVKISEFMRLVPLTREIIVSNIQKGEIPGRKIGGNWFIDGKYCKEIATFRGFGAQTIHTKGEDGTPQ